MAPRISLALAIHNHQPVGNFGWVMAEVYDLAYEPMVAALERHSHVRLSLHYSGPLLEWLRAERPDFIARLSALVARDQVEIIGGGYYEPVLASLPERDRIGQARRMSEELEALFGKRPIGAWLAERVWEPDLPTSLVAAGYDWTILDDAHFRSAAIPEEDLWGPYTTEDQGQLLRVFGTEQGLRYRIPFRTVKEVIDYLRDHATDEGDRVGMMGDDGEKFGAWPTTWEHCWGERRWVDDFFEALEENGDWLTTTTPTDWLEDHAPIGRVYVPTGSYAEMGEWALPPEESLAFATALHAAVAKHRPEARWLRGAFWRNYQVRYREINDMHKQMLRTSEAVEAMTAGDDRDRALDHLYQGQSNDTYWHGLFGGIYISHMRLATYEHLIAAEDLAETDIGRLHEAERLDLDLDGHDEVRLSGPGQVVSIDMAEGAGIGGWDIRPVRHNVCSVMRRRPEAYHKKLRDHAEAEPNPDPAPAAHGRPDLDPRDLPGQGAGPRGDAPLRPVRAPLGPGPVPGARHDPGRMGDRRGRRAQRCGRGRLRDRDARARSARCATGRHGVHGTGWRVCRRSGGQDLLARRRSSVADPDRGRPDHEPVGVDGRGDPRARVDGHDARRRRQPGCLAGDRRDEDHPRRPPDRDRPDRPGTGQ